ncbi:hypothetical protein DP939_37615 [Spongiactinospora rosea]|uniref:Uncharacterized protein n=1 Tax=Spongiactinospora rosea TaxID=2248750 RepID=A0A366LPL7_9ACTN|nr:hypothetical protein [Spongiactinospora rosea]RBQ15122.1 hypothetical protein DP939_37615 [Spongiactinospora rosea]
MYICRIGATPDSAIFDAEGEFQHVYQPRSGELILIRPDGYIAARTPADREADLIDHLAKFRSRGNQVGQA